MRQAFQAVKANDKMKTVILASASPRRQELLRQLGVDFDVIVPDVDENIDEVHDPELFVQNLALSKCMNVVDRLRADNSRIRPKAVIAADTIVVKDGILGKPADAGDAFRMLKLLQSSWHEVITGIALYVFRGDVSVTSFESTRVKMCSLSDEDIHAYIATREPFDKAGAYAIQGFGAILVERIEGCFYNVVGLPVSKLVRMLKQYVPGYYTMKCDNTR